MAKTTAKDSALIELLNSVHLAEELPEFFYHQLLETALKLIPEARLGTVLLVEPEAARFVASLGHKAEILLNLELQPSWVFHNPEVQVVKTLEAWYQKRLPRALYAQFIQGAQPTAASLVGTYTLGHDRHVILSLDIPADKAPRFSVQSKETLGALLQLAGRHQRLVQQERDLEQSRRELDESNRTLETSYFEINRLSDKLRQILTLTSRLGEGNLGPDVYFRQLLDTALLVVEQADYGTVSLLVDGQWRFLAAAGHDLAGIRELKLKAADLGVMDKVTQVKDLYATVAKRLMPEAGKALLASTRPTESSLVVSLPVTEQVTVNLSLDRRKDSEHEFPKSSWKIFEAFAQLACSFFKLRFHAEAMTKAYQNFSTKLARVAEVHDPETAEHNQRVANLSAFLAQKLGCDVYFVEEIRAFAVLHDIGKIFLDQKLLNKSEALSADEFARVQRHTLFSEELLDDPFFATARNIALYHHERYDGSGYPYGLKGEEIPLEAQLVSVADVFDALRSKRPYKEALPALEVMRIFHEGDGRIKPGMFNPRLLRLLDSNVAEIETTFYLDSDEA